ncbi:GntR family transcriptional regulator [Rhizobium sp. S152]|uniref:GntR family transcriptional regulator n=1 Tax=Rhizobium sp. S152 TaxID=3055038 RepID=UPI0025A9FAB7|nr:GntR family transcriptional regulator [Rhizobium sp. S152]MDM9627906.1 GntR family transcriptional regulator [Rhizobium sp. S152]
MSTQSLDAHNEADHPPAVALRGTMPEEQMLYDRLIDAIIDKRLRPGQHLNEVKLAAAYNVPRSRIRRVLERLRDESVVEFQLNRGAFVSRPTVKEAIDVFEARRHLDVAIAEMVCRRATQADIVTLRHHVGRQHQVIHTGGAEINRVGADFHELLAEMSGNEVIRRMLTVLMRRVSLIQSLYERSNSICLVHDHETLIDKIEAGDVEGARNEALRHCEHIEAALDFTERRRLEIDIYELP